MALATSIFMMVELIRAFGFSTELIQKQDAGRAHYDTGNLNARGSSYG